MPLIMIGGAPGSVGPPPGNHFFATYLGAAASDTDDAASYTLNVDFGDYDPDRQIIVVAMWARYDTLITLPSAISIGDDSAPELDAISQIYKLGSMDPQGYVAVYRGAPTNSGVASIEITPATANWRYVCVFVFSTTDPVVPYQVQSGIGPDSCESVMRLGVPQGGFVIGGCGRFTGLDLKNDVNWTSLTSDAIQHGNNGSRYAECGVGHANNLAAGTLDVIAEGWRSCATVSVAYGASTDIPDVDWSSVFQQNYTYNASGINHDFSGYTIRGVLPASVLSNLPGSPDKVRLTLISGDIETLEIDKFYVGHAAASGDAWDAADLTQVTFEGSPGIAIAPNTQAVSDDISWAYDGTSNIVISFHVSGDTSHDRVNEITGITGALSRAKSAVDEAATLDVTGYGTALSFVSDGIPLLCKLDLGQSAP